MTIQIIENGTITTPQGFKAGVSQAAIKKANRYDMALIYSPIRCSAAGVFTRNLVAAAPVMISKAHLTSGCGHAIVVNSGCANACTGDQGYQDAGQMAKLAAEALACEVEDVFVASTGVIGAYLPMEKVAFGIKAAAEDMSAEHGHLAAQAIMTTDTVAKEIAVQVEVDGTLVTFGAMAKGSGMIHPDMATMLGFITTDAAIAPKLLQEALREACEATFNMVTVDGDTSTNDSLFILANGLAQNKMLNKADDAGYAAFKGALTYVCAALAKMIAKDGEGATKFLTVRIEGAKTVEDARKAARTVAGSSLVKAAIYGKDANWGRMICALGYSGIEFDPAKVDMYLGPIKMMAKGSGLIFDEEAAKEYFEQDEILAVILLHEGDCQAEAWGCDLTHEYVSINADYRS
jgi:glutamate N-acetyltransferase/amino-acid N-acetyltransferase